MATAEDGVPSASELRQLAHTVYTREYIAIKDTKFPSTTDRLKALQYAKEALENAVKLLDEGGQNQQSQSPEAKRASEEVWRYVRASLWGSLNATRNMKLRSDYIGKIRANASTYRAQIAEAGLAEAEAIAENAVVARNAVLEATRARLSKSSQFFSQWLKREGISFQDLLTKYSEKSFPGTPFESLGDNQKLSIYGDIIQASGRSNAFVNTISKIQGTLGVVELLVLCGVVVWDIITAANPIITATKDAWVAVGAAGIGFLGDSLASAAVSAGLVAAGVAETTAAAIAFIAGVAAGLILVVLVAPLLGSLFDLIANAFSLSIPPQLMTSMITVMKVPLDSPLTLELTSPIV